MFQCLTTEWKPTDNKKQKVAPRSISCPEESVQGKWMEFHWRPGIIYLSGISSLHSHIKAIFKFSKAAGYYV